VSTQSIIGENCKVRNLKNARTIIFQPLTIILKMMPNTTYVFELKVDGTAREALDQINSKGYALPYPTDGRRVVKVGIRCDRDTMTIDEWIVE